MSSDTKPVFNKTIVFREEFDDWAVLFNPDTNDVFALNPVSIFVWRRLDGKHTIDDIYNEMLSEFNNIPEEAMDQIKSFISDLSKQGLIVEEPQQENE